jgi:hypothetical protein
MNCLLVSCRLLNFLPETHDVPVIAINSKRGKNSVLFILTRIIYEKLHFSSDYYDLY